MRIGERYAVKSWRGKRGPFVLTSLQAPGRSSSWVEGYFPESGGDATQPVSETLQSIIARWDDPEQIEERAARTSLDAKKEKAKEILSTFGIGTDFNYERFDRASYVNDDNVCVNLDDFLRVFGPWAEGMLTDG